MTVLNHMSCADMTVVIHVHSCQVFIRRVRMLAVRRLAQSDVPWAQLPRSSLPPYNGPILSSL